MDLKNSELAGDEVSYQSGSRGTVESNDFGNFYFRLGSKDVSILDNDFSLSKPVGSVGSLVDEFYDNRFSAGTTIQVDETVDRDVAWSATAGIDTFEMINVFGNSADITVASGNTLTIGPGVTVTTAGQFDEFFVDGTIDVNGVEFVGANNEIIVRDGGRLDLRNSELTGNRVFYAEGSLGSVVGAVFYLDLEIHSESQATIQQNSISGDVTSTGIDTEEIDLRNNYWFTTNPDSIENRILHREDDDRRPLVLYEPFLDSPPNQGASFGFTSSNVSRPEGNSGDAVFSFTVDRANDASVQQTIQYMVGPGSSPSADTDDLVDGFVTKTANIWRW